MDAIEAVIELLVSDTALMSLVTDVGHLSVQQDTPTPYLLISDVSATPFYSFHNGEDASRWAIDIEVVADLTGINASGYSVCKSILDLVKSLMQDHEEALITEGGTTVCLRRGKRLPSRLLTQSGGEQYLRCGHEWELVTS